ncbi:MAG: phage tail terminator-like protein [Spirochaetales bacterium]|jgi:hypothetical protein|nr:phage tail terminator-like protein [Spirochaetales bacterium]
MSAPFADIRAAFTTKLMALSPLPSIAWENVAFTPVIGTSYLQPFLLPGEPYQAEIGEAGQNRHTGIYQVSIYAPTGSGVGDINTLAGTICDHFKRGTVLTYSTTTLTIKKAFLGPMMTDTDWLHLPVTIQYHLLAAN